MKTKSIFVSASTLLIISLLTACNALKPAPIPTATPVIEPATGLQYYFVTNQLMLPATQVQADDFALNVDMDSGQRGDNKVGDLLALLTSAAQGIELQATLDQAVDAGQLVLLHTIMADDPLNDRSVSWDIFLGQRSASAPLFDGSDKFTLDSASPDNEPISGSITNGHFSGGPGATHVQVFLLGQPVDIGLIGVRIEADFTAQGCTNGKLGGGVTVDEFNGKLLPALTAGLNQIIQSNSSVANTVLPVFDSNNDGAISIEELKGNPLLMLAVNPDLDLLDASGNFSPGQDGVKDAFSIGLGFTCVPAIFTVALK